MRRCYFIVILAVIIFSAGLLMAQEDAKQEIPEGMEIRMVGQVRLVVPEEAKVEEKDGLIIVESIDKYVARSLFQMKQNIKTLEKQQQELVKEIQQLKNSLEDRAKQ